MHVKRPKLLASVLLFLAVINGWIFLFFLDYENGKPLTWGVTFSDKYARDLELDWRKAYLAILDDLRISDIRLIAYWDQIEETPDVFVYDDLDWQIAEANKRGVKIVLSVGRRAPRWPECHDPLWLRLLAPLAAREQQLDFIQRIIARYKDNPNITAWQIENEPLFVLFGECPLPNKQFLAQEVSAVRTFDQRPIIITDSGELNHWQGAASIGDKLGITMYRIVWNRYLGFWDYWFVPPAVYRLKADVTKMLHKNLNDVIVTELQMEPWTLDKRMVELTSEERERSFTLERFRNNIEYVKRAGFTETYLWGVEYWYWLKEHGQSDIWNESKKLW